MGVTCYNARSMGQILIEVDDLSKTFGDFVAVDGVSLHVAAGEVLALLGPNGAGKTTTIRMLSSLLRPTRGWAKIDGHDVVLEPRAVRKTIGLLTEHHGLYTRMRPKEYLRFFGRTYEMDPQRIEERSDALLARLELGDALDRRLGEFSKGMRQKLVLARTLLHDPPVLLLDEPTSAMDPASARLVRRSIAGLRSSKRAIIVCTHNLSEAEMLADRIAIIRKGKIAAQGSPASLKQQILGFPIMHVHLSKDLNGLEPNLPDGASLLEQGQDWIRYKVQDPIRTNPTVLQFLERQGLRVITLSEVGRSLEDVYLQVVRRADLSQEVTL